MTTEELDALAAAVEAMTKGDLVINGDSPMVGVMLSPRWGRERPTMDVVLTCHRPADRNGLVALRNAAPALIERARRADQLTEAMAKISAIRDSIVGCQGFSFSEHAYPLVAVLNAAGFKGAGYEIARKNLGTLLDRNKALEAELRNVLASARPNERDHPCMSAAWKRAEALLNPTETTP